MTEHKTPVFEYALVQSRAVILEMMEARGYNISPYKLMNPADIIKLSITPEALMMKFKHNDDETREAIVQYNEKSIKNSLRTFLEKTLEKVADGTFDPQTEMIHIVYTPVVDTFHQFAINAWNKHKLRYQFFFIETLVSNPMKHALQPKFEIVPEDDVQSIMKAHYIKSKTQLPIIKYHEDIVARFMGLVPGSIVKITRPSPSAGLYILYRLCSP